MAIARAAARERTRFSWSAPPFDATDRWIALFVALTALLFQLPIFDRWLALLDEGYVLQIADDINRGKVLYRDVNVDNPFPGAFYLLAWWFQIAGASIRSSRYLSVAGFAVYAAAFYRIGRAALPRAWSLVLVALLLCYRVWAFPHWQVYHYSLVSATLITVAVALVASALERGSRALLILAGVAAGGSIMAKQDYGLAVTGAVGLALLLAPLASDGPLRRWLDWLRPPLIFAIGAALVVVPALAYFVLQGAGPQMLEQAFWMPLSGAIQSPYARLPSLTPLFAQDPALRADIGSYFPSILATLWWSDIGTGPIYRETAIWDVALKLVFYLPILCFAASAIGWGGAIALRARRGLRDAGSVPLLLLLAYAGGFLLSFNRPRDWVHLMMVYPPSLLLAGALLWHATQIVPRALAVVLRAGAVVAVACLGAVTIALMVDLRRQIDWWLPSARARVYADPRNGPIIADVIEYAARSAPPAEIMPVYPIQPMLNFLTGREAAAGFHVIWPVQDKGRDAKIVADLERRKPSRILYSLSQYAVLGTFQSNARQLFDYLVTHYEIDEVFSRQVHGPLLTALRRRDPSCAGDSRPLHDVVHGAAAPVLERWPFGEVLSQAVGTPEKPAPLRLALTVPSDRPVLAFGYGVNPDRWMALERGPFTFTIRVRKSDAAAGEVVFEKRVDPAREVSDRRWMRADVDLSALAGAPIEIELSIDAPTAPANPRGLAGWMEPRFVVRATSPDGHAESCSGA